MVQGDWDGISSYHFNILATIFNPMTSSLKVVLQRWPRNALCWDAVWMVPQVSVSATQTIKASSKQYFSLHGFMAFLRTEQVGVVAIYGRILLCVVTGTTSGLQRHQPKTGTTRFLLIIDNWSTVYQVPNSYTHELWRPYNSMV